MEHYFRTALWMLFLIGCFQAAPTNIKGDINFDLLRKGVKFEGNVTFKFPKDVSDSCLGEAVSTIIKGLKHAKEYTTSKYGPRRCNDALASLHHHCSNIILPHNDSSDCKTQEERSLNFEDFLNEFETIIERINSNCTEPTEFL